MARGAAKQRTARPKPDAQRRKRPVTSGYGGVESELFFYRLRRHAKWMFVFLALVFAGGFVFFGVGSGSSIGDLLQGNFSRGGGGGSSISSLQNKVAKNPKNAQAWRDLATALQQKGRTSEATRALEHYTKLRPRDTDALGELASFYQAEASDKQQEYQLALYEQQSSVPPSPVPPLQLKNGQTLAATDPITQTLTSRTQSRAQSALIAADTAIRNAERIYKKLVALTPADTTLLFQLGDTARAANDSKTAVAAYKKFIRLAPDDPKTPDAKQYIKQLSKGK